MASFSRSFKPHSYLSPMRRPNMPGRSLSNTSLHSEDGERASHEHNSPAPSPKVRPVNFGSRVPSEPKTHSGVPKSSRPPPIDIPTIKKVSSAPTPPEPLSARGDRPGGYFPFHEDPNRRVHRPHPFEAKGSIQQHQPNYVEPPQLTPSPGPAPTASMTFSHTPVATYYPTGHPDQSLPLGKYYPSNWENREHSRPSSTTGSRSSTPKSPSQKGLNSPKLSAAESEVRRRVQLQQYKRDMVAQASLAANEVMGQASHHKGRGITVTGAGLPTMSGGEARFGASVPYRPASPRLHPMNSPGPVTPIELGSSASGGDYLQGAPTTTETTEPSPHTT